MRFAILFFAISSCIVGCDRTHMSADYGQATRRAFRVQRIETPGDQPVHLGGLEPGEATIVLDTYRRSLSSGKGGKSDEAPVMLLNPSGTDKTEKVQ